MLINNKQLSETILFNPWIIGTILFLMPDETKNIHDIMYLTNFILDSLLPFHDGSHKISSRKFDAHGQIGCNYCITLFAETT